MKLVQMTEADEIANNIAKARGKRPKTWKEARAIVTEIMGGPDEIGRQLHDNITESLLIGG